MAFTKDEIQNLSDLFLSVNDDNTKLAFEIMGDKNFPKELITEVFAVYKLTDDEELKKKAETILKLEGSDRIKTAMKWTLKLNNDGSLYGATEKTIAKNISRYCDGVEMVGKKLATAMFRKFGVGSNYLLNNVPANERKENLKIFIQGNTFKLRNAALTKFPPELFDYPDLEEIDIAGNKIATIPAQIKTFQKLRILRIHGNNLKTINKAILQLKNLEELYIQANLFKEFPEIICQLTWLKKLDITSVTNSTYYRGLLLPDSFKNLNNLVALGLCNYSSPVGSTQYYNPYRNYPLVRWLESTDGKALDLEPLALAKASYHQNGHAVAFILRYSDDVALKKEILSSFYDASSKTMDFKETYLENLPEEILDFDIETLILDDTRLGSVGSYFRTKEEEEKGHSAVDCERLAILPKMTNLRNLQMKDIALSGLPVGIGQLKKLEYLDLRYNYIKGVSPELGELTNLTKMKLYSAFSHYDEAIEIPDSFANLTKLKELSFHFYEMDEAKYLGRLESLLPDCTITTSYL